MPDGKSTLPTGWFQVAWSGDLQIGDIRPLRYFGRDLVLYRGRNSGRAVVLDAHCPHLGAHLGYPFDQCSPGVEAGPGEGVDGDNIRCPWHQWSWSPEGRNVDIPYSDRPFRGKGPQPWHVREANGFIMVWHDLLGRAPSWEPPIIEELQPDSDHFPIHPWAIKNWKGLRMRAQHPIENSADFAHLRFVHRHVGDINVLKLDVEGHRFSTTIETSFDTSKGKMPGFITPVACGLGLLYIRLTGISDITHIANPTPVDEETTDWFTAVAIKKKPGEDKPSRLAHALLEAEHVQAERDIHIWTHAKWIDRPPFPREEAQGYRALREWSTQFYPDIPAAGPESSGTDIADEAQELSV